MLLLLRPEDAALVGDSGPAGTADAATPREPLGVRRTTQGTGELDARTRPARPLEPDPIASGDGRGCSLSQAVIYDRQRHFQAPVRGSPAET